MIQYLEVHRNNYKEFITQLERAKTFVHLIDELGLRVTSCPDSEGMAFVENKVTNSKSLTLLVNLDSLFFECLETGQHGYLDDLGWFRGES